MADVSSDPYEQKLYQMFSSHDRGDSGSLDANDLRQLCHTLDLKDRETVLVEACLRNAEAHSGRVTFRGFKDGLLTLLGDGNCAGDSSENSAAIATAAAAPASATTADQDADDNNDGALKTTTTMVRNNGGEQHFYEQYSNNIVDATDSGTAAVTIASPSREVSPKYVVAGKKYGRRSRPTSGAFDDMSSTDSDGESAANLRSLEPQHQQQQQRTNHKSAQKVQRSSSHSELHGNVEPTARRRRPTSGGKLKRCASLPAQPKPFKRPGSSTDETNFDITVVAAAATVSASTTQIGGARDVGAQLVRESSVESLDNLDFENLSHSLYDVWSKYGRSTNNCLSQSQLELVCEQVGLHARVARKVAEEVFQKLGLCTTPIDADDTVAADTENVARVSFGDFIALIQSDNDMQCDNNSSSSMPMQCADDALMLMATPSALLLSTFTSTTSTTTTRPVAPSNIVMMDVGGGGEDGEFVSCGTDSGLNTSKDSSGDASMLTTVGQAGEWPVESSAVPAEVIVDMWDNAGIPNSRSLLDTLGFRSKEIRISQLSLAIEDDLQTMPSSAPENHAAQTLLRASLALHKAEVNALQLAFRQLAAQNRKLHANNRDTNRRAALLAQEVDERHGHLETARRNEIQQLEQRHAETIREMTVQMTADREQLTAYTVKLEQQNKTHSANDDRQRLQSQLAAEENSALETELISVQRQCADLLEENIRLNNTIVDVDERQRAEDTRKGDRENEELLELMEKVSALQMENANLRDKNDELVSEVEDKLVELTRLRGKSTTSPTAQDAVSEAAGVSAIKRRGDSPSKAKISEESPKLGKLRKCSNDESDTMAETSDCSGDWMALNAELSQSQASNNTTATVSVAVDAGQSAAGIESGHEDVAQLKQRIGELQKRLQRATSATEQGQQILELETSLEQMRKEFEDLEDYWQAKLNEERQLFEMKEHKSDEKFDELLKKMAEYEEQFVAGMEKAANSRLSPIEERDVLEQQYVELEDEIEELREHARKVIDSKDDEIVQLGEQLNRLQQCIQDATDEAAQLKFVATAAQSTPAELPKAPEMVTAVMPLCEAPSSGRNGGISCRSLDGDSPASSPISYLWTQSTIQAPARDYQNPNWGNIQNATIAESLFANDVNALAISTAKALKPNAAALSNSGELPEPFGHRRLSQQSGYSGPGGFSGTGTDDKRDSASESSSVHSYSVPSVASTYNIRNLSAAADDVSGAIQKRDELKRLKLVEMKLQHDIQELSAQRNSILAELQQLQEFRPAIERTAAYARSNHPSLMQRNLALEHRIRVLEQCLKNQHQYNETMMQQTCVQHTNVVGVLHGRLEEQQVVINEQAARLVNNDLFAKDMFVENSQLGDLLEQQRMCNARLRQNHQQI